MGPKLTAEEARAADRLERALQVMLKSVAVDGDVILFVKEDTPAGRHLHAWTYPADAYLEGPGGSLAIAFRRKTLGLPWRDQAQHILAHEVGHAVADAPALREGRPVGEIATELLVAEMVLRDAAKELEGVAA